MYISIIIIAIALAMDATAVSIGVAAAMPKWQMRSIFRMSFHFGFFQFFMPLIGWIVGSSVSAVLQQYDHWVSFGLLSFIAGHMAYEGFSNDKIIQKDPTRGIRLIVLSFATSIDALAVGLSLSFLKVAIILPAIIIGIITFLLSVFGVYIGNKIGHFFERKIAVIGGLLLIAIGIKILVEHLF